MQGNAEVIEVLNEVLTAELTAINQYFIHAKMLGNWGYKRLAEHSKHESIDEMKHADEVMERILYLDGVPNMQRYFKVNVGQNVPEMHQLDLELEKVAVERLNKGIELCRTRGDNGSRMLLEEILEEEESHIDWLEAQLKMIEDMGLPNYLAEQMKD